MKCSEIMERNVITCRDTESAQQCARVMRDQNIGFMPVVDERDHVIGTVTDRDLVVRLLANGKNGSTPVGELATRELVFCGKADDLLVCESKMAHGRIARILVLDGGRVCGVISLSDIAQCDDTSRVGQLLRNVTEREQRDYV